MLKARNIIGAQVRRLRNQHELTQEQFAARLQVMGLEISRAGLSKIEAGLRCVSDMELPFIAEALNVDIMTLFPKRTSQKRSARKLP